jgi:signal peptidase I
MSEAAQSGTRRLGGIAGFLRDLVIILVIAFTVSFVVKTFLMRAFYIPSGSMMNTLQVNDRILVNQLVPDIVPVSRGDVVVFHDPGGWLNARAITPPTGVQWVLQELGLAASPSDEFVIKRVIGLPGDRVACCDAAGRVTVNGVPIVEPYVLLPPGETLVSDLAFDVEVPQDSYWVMGDNRYASKDSRYNQDQPGRGFVLQEEIVGRAFVLNWPLNRLSWLSDYPDTFIGVDEAAGSDPESAAAKIATPGQ